MQITPIKTKILQPPQDNLYEIFEESLPELQEKDVLVVTSKVLSIHQGRCIPITDDIDKKALVQREADNYLPWKDTKGEHVITVVRHALISAGGIDKSNANEHFILLPKDIEQETKRIWEYLKERFGLKEVGVLVTDSRSMPMRLGAMGVALSWYGFRPLYNYVGKPDLFGRTMQVSRTNIPDSLAAAAGFVIGEGAQGTPLAVIRGAELEFCEEDTHHELFVDSEEDMFYPLLQPFLDNKN